MKRLIFTLFFTAITVFSQTQTLMIDSSNNVLQQANFKDSLITVIDNIDETKIAQFQASGITTGTTRTYTLPDADGTLIVDGSVFDYIDLNASAGEPAYREARFFWDNVNKTFTFFNDESEVSLQVGQEIWVRVYNDTGSTITNGQVCYISGVNGSVPTVGLAMSDDKATSSSTLGFATHDIETGTNGYITVMGTVRNVDTSTCTAGDTLYLSSTVPGGFTKTEPDSPNYSVKLGSAMVINATTGSILTSVDIGNNISGMLKFFNGTILESPSFSVSSNGTVITGSLEKSGGGDLNLVFNSDFEFLDCTPAATATLTAGSDTVPTMNYVFIKESAPTVIQVNTTGFIDTEQIIPICQVLCQSAASLQTDGPMKQHNWTDHFADSIDQGHLYHVNAWIRNQNSTYDSGMNVTATGGVNTFDIAVASGVMFQLHPHDTDVFNTATGSELYIINDSVTPNNKVGNLTTVINDSTGASMSGDHYRLTLWLVGSEGTGNDKLMINLPSGSYAKVADAIADSSQYSNFSIPTDYRGTGLLLASIVVTNSGGSGGTFTIVQTDDLRGLLPSTAAGGATGTGFVDPMTTRGDIIIRDATNTTERLAIGTNGYVLTSDGTDVAWAASASGFSDPMTTRGDIIIRNAANATARLGVGTNGQILTTDGTDITWGAASGGGSTNFYINADAMKSQSTNGATKGETELSTNSVMIAYADFDAATDEFLQYDLIMPSNYSNGTITCTFEWTSVTTAGTGDVVWGCQAMAVSNDDPYDATWGTAVTVTDTFIAAGDRHYTSATSAITIGGTPATGDSIHLRFYRDADNGSDTYTQDARLVRVLISF